MTKTEFAKTILTIKAVVIRNHDEVLLLKRSDKSKNPGKWDLPGGHLDKGETIQEALVREILEETKLEVETGEILGTTEFSKKERQFKDEKRGLRYLAYYKSGEVKLDKKEHQDFVWLKIGEALEKFSEKDGFENEKREAVLKAKKILEMKNAENAWRRAVADLENYKKRVAQNNEDFKKYCLEGYILGLLPVLDNFDLALQHVPKGKENDGWLIGIMHIRKQLEDFLIENGVSVMEVKLGDRFDENIHEAIETSAETAKETSKVSAVLKRGYKMGEKIIRPAMVKL